MTAPTNIRDEKWRKLSREVAAKLDAAEARTDFPSTLFLIDRYRKRLAANQAAIDASEDAVTREVNLSAALATFGINGLWPAICDVESQSRFHGRQSLEMKHG